MVANISNLKNIRNFVAVLTLLTSIVAIQMFLAIPAFAGNPVDLDLHSVSRVGANQGIAIESCNLEPDIEGSESIKSITFDIQLTNAVLVDSFMGYMSGLRQAGFGEFDLDTLTWTGLLAPEECVTVIIELSETGELGDEVTTSVEIVSSIQADDSPNIDGDATNNDEQIIDPYTIAILPDLKAQGHLTTPGEISPTTEVDYQIDISNSGPGVYHNTGDMIFSFILPAESSFLRVEDGNEDDAITFNGSSCFYPLGEEGTVGDLGLAGAEDYANRKIVVCFLNAASGKELIEPGDTTFPFHLILTAGTEIANGTSDVIGILQDNEYDSFEHMKVNSAMYAGESLTINDLDMNDNFFHLQYDPSALVMTASRCPGQGATTNDGTGCFRVSFNKAIWAPDFILADLELEGGGTITSLTQLNSNEWEVRVQGITPGSTVTLKLKEDSVQDYSAVMNNVSVLGESTIRFDVASTQGSASGALPETGNNGSNLMTAFVLLFAGLALRSISRQKRFS